MADAVEKAVERLAQLEATVANGFHEMELRFSALDRKINVSVEALRSDIRTVAETITAVTAEMRRTTDSIRQEHAADREVLRLSLLNHAARIHKLERFNGNR